MEGLSPAGFDDDGRAQLEARLPVRRHGVGLDDDDHVLLQREEGGGRKW